MSTNILSYELLSESQCARLIRDSASLTTREGLVYGKDRSGEIDPVRYRGREAFIDLLPPHDWLRGVLQSALDRAVAHFGIARLRLLEMPRLLTYEAGSHFDWHVDAAPGMFGRTSLQPTRCLTGSIQISSPDAYSGGELLTINNGCPETASRAQGNIVLFPAEWRHKVCPVTFGARVSLVFWGYS